MKINEFANSASYIVSALNGEFQLLLHRTTHWIEGKLVL